MVLSSTSAWVRSPALAATSKPSLRSPSLATTTPVNPPLHWSSSKPLDNSNIISGHYSSSLTMDRPVPVEWWEAEERKWVNEDKRLARPATGGGIGLEKILFPISRNDGSHSNSNLLETKVVMALISQLALPLGIFYMSILLVLSTYVQLYQQSIWRLSRMAKQLQLAKNGLQKPKLGRTASAKAREHAEALKSGLYWYGIGDVCERDDGLASPYFDPSRPSVIYVHGYQPKTIIRQFRESLNWKANDDEYGLDVNAADAWLKAGYNVGMFYWNQYADENFIHDAEAKIWTNETSVGMRYRVLTKDGKKVQYRYFSTPSTKPTVPCVSRQLADILQQRFPTSSSAPYRLVGHSLGSQVVVHTAKLLSQDRHTTAEKGDFRLPSNIALLDAFFTLEPKRYLGWRTVGSVLAEEVEALTTQDKILVEQYQTSILSNAARGILKPLTAFFELDIPHIPWYKLRARHVAAPYLYFLSFAAMMKWIDA